MHKITLICVTLIAILAGTTGTASAGTWKPGNPTMVEEDEMQDLLEQTYDFAYCTGIPRFGHKGEFPYETFVVFDCDVKLDDQYCTDYRVKAIKASRRGYFKLRFLRDGDCY